MQEISSNSSRSSDALSAVRREFFTQLVSTPEGRQHMLSFSVDAEEGDEGAIFDQLAVAVEEPKLRRIVERHRDDEIRHGTLFRACLARLGLEKVEVPDEIRIIRQIASSSGGAERPVRTAEDIVATYAMLFVIEQRGVEQFPFLSEAFRAVDPETADTYDRVARDERGHVHYCETIGRHYAADDAAWQSAVTRARSIEESAFQAVGMANLTYCAERGWVRMDAVLGAA